MTPILDKAKTLSEALPYIQRYHGKTFVIKYGGNAMQTEALCHSVIGDIVLLSLVGISIVVVHGGGPEINEALALRGIAPRFANGLRYTDAETMDVVQTVLCGRVSKQIVQRIHEHGGKALSLSGIDGEMLKARKLDDPAFDYGFAGKISAVDAAPIQLALSGGYIPVVSSVACGHDDHLQSYNINADTAAAHIAAAVGAEKLILLTDVPGLLRDVKDPASRISEISVSAVAPLVKDGTISGGFIPKVECCVEAVRNGVPRTHILDGRVPHCLLVEIFSNTGVGTMIYA